MPARKTPQSDRSTEADLKQREYRDEHGEIHHHTRSYMEEHDNRGSTRRRPARRAAASRSDSSDDRRGERGRDDEGQGDQDRGAEGRRDRERRERGAPPPFWDDRNRGRAILLLAVAGVVLFGFSRAAASRRVTYRAPG